MDRTWYPGYAHNWDDSLFREEILKVAKPTDRLLDLGAGRGIVHQMNLKGVVARVVGVDPDRGVVNNPHLAEAVVARGERLPWADNSFDLVIANNVLEHLTQPTIVFKEVARVLKPTGYFLTKTPNLLHYVPLLALATPLHFHRWLVAWRGRQCGDVFSTGYKANSPRALRRCAEAATLKVRAVLLFEGRPEYLRFTPVLYPLGFIYERIVNSSRLFSPFRISMIAVLQKPRCDTSLRNSAPSTQHSSLRCQSDDTLGD